jgi:hypothetical protein
VGAKYVGGVRHTYDDSYHGSELVNPEKMLQEGWTLQIHQPQRFNDNLWRLCASLEGSLGCLVGCNQYITPPGKQGLAPHYDDVEIFVLQVQGEKLWKLYEKKEFMLANAPSGDLLETSLGAPPSMEVTLRPGDCLYMPRGTVHHATASSQSSHLTISTYQRWTVLDIAHQVLGAALELPATQLTLPRPLKRSLEPRLLSTLSIDSKVKSLTSSIATALTDFARHIEENKVVEGLWDALIEDFMAHRLPPHPGQLPLPSTVSITDVPPFGIDDVLVARAPSFFLVMPPDKSTGTEPICRVLSCLENCRETHMLQSTDYDLAQDSHDEGEDDEDEDEEDEEDDDGEKGRKNVLVTRYFGAIEQLLIRQEQVRIGDLDVSLPVGKPNKGDTSQAIKQRQLQLARELWEFGAVVHHVATKESRKKTRLN